VTGWVHDGQAWCAPADSAEQMRERGAEVAALLRAGDVLILDGPLGAGKTTFTQGIGTALSVRGQVTSPTFVIARSHPPLMLPTPEAGAEPAPWLVHVDAYRLGGAVEVEDLDLEADLERAVTVVEWGAGKVEGLAPHRLEVLIRRDVGSPLGPGDPAGGARTVRVRGVGPRWAGLLLGPV